MGKRITVVYAEETRFFTQRVILRTASIAAMFHTSKRLEDPPIGHVWTLIQDGNVSPEMPSVLSATGSVWLDGGTNPFLTRDSLDPGDNVGDPLLDAWVLSVKGTRRVTGLWNSLTLCPS